MGFKTNAERMRSRRRDCFTAFVCVGYVCIHRDTQAFNGEDVASSRERVKLEHEVCRHPCS